MAETPLSTRLRLAPGPVDLRDYPTDGKAGAPGGKSRTRQELGDSGAELALLQEKLFAGAKAGDARNVLLVLQGSDTSGKDGTTKHVADPLTPAGLRITSFGKPTPAEAAHHFLWRIRRALPAPGIIGVFNRSQYEDVLITRVHGWIDEPTWLRRIEEINAFEAELRASGTVIVKCFLHIGYVEQRERLLARLDDPTKYWKFNPADLAERARWSDYQATYAEVLWRTSTEIAPWYVIPSDRKWYRNWAVGQLLLEALRGMDLSYPDADFDIAASRQALQPPH